MRSSRTLIVLTALAASGGMLAGCSNGVGGGGELTYEDSPLGEYLSALYGGEMSPDDQQAEFDRQQVEMEEAMAECMAEEGFEYIPNTGNGVIVMGDDTEWDPDSREWVEQYGYGAFNSPWDDEAMNPDEEYVDPNQEYVESLSESEMEAYYATLYGESPTEEQAMDPEFDWSTLDMGCQGEASDAAFNQTELEALYEQYEPLMNKMNELYEAAESSDEMVELNADWASCMADGGYPGFSVQYDAQQSIYDRQNEMWEAQNSASEDFDWENATEEEIEEFYNSTDPSNTPEWAEAAEEEIAIALVDLDCREETNYRTESLRVQFDLEEQFIADNEAELEAFRAAAEQVM